jgi:hypothetical protein
MGWGVREMEIRQLSPGMTPVFDPGKSFNLGRIWVPEYTVIFLLPEELERLLADDEYDVMDCGVLMPYVIAPSAQERAYAWRHAGEAGAHAALLVNPPKGGWLEMWLRPVDESGSRMGFLARHAEEPMARALRGTR